MKQFKFTFLLTILMSMVGMRAFAYDAKIDGIYYDFSGTEATVTYYSDYTNMYAYIGNVVIPESVTYNGITYSVTTIGRFAFYKCSGLTSITIPNSVTSIGYSAFLNCPSLTSITIPNSVTSIDNQAFQSCSGLTSITIPNSVTDIGDAVFRECSGMTSCTIESGVTSIGYYSFSGCTGLTSITIPNSVTSIGKEAFYNTRLKSVTIGSGVLSIGSNVFGFDSSSGTKPTKVIWLTNTPPTGFYDAEGTVNYVANDSYTRFSNKKVYPFLSSMFEVDGVKYVPVSPSERTCDAIDCAYNESVENINIGKTVSYQGINLTVKDVNQYVFYQNVFIKEVNLSFEGNLGDYAFQDCTDITKVVVKNAGNVGVSAFSGITGEFTANINNEGFIGSEAFYNSTGLKTLDVGTNVTDIGFGAFIGCTRLETVKLQNQGVIGHNAFQNCTAMTAATLGKKITSIGQYAFSNCSALEKIVIPNAVKTLGDYAFSGCSSMASAKIGTSVITIGSGAFSGCSALPQIVIPQSVTTINDYVFKGCSSLTNVNMEERKSDKTVLTLGSNDSNPLFADCPLDEVYIGRNISYSTEGYRGYSPFYRNTSLRSVTITDRETEISMNEFYGCTNLQDVTIGDGVESFGDWAFSGCSSLKHFSFGMNVEKIGREAFSDCTSMESIFSRSPEPPVCDDQALDDINKWICTLTVPAGNKAAYMAADQWKDFFYIEEGDAVKKYFDISIEANEGGRVLVNDKEESKVSMKKGSDVVLRFTPEEGHTLKQVLVNGEDVTSQVVDGCYTLTEISADMTIKVVFSDTSGISTIKADDEDVKWYTLDGHRIDAPRKGLNIVRVSNGKTKKVLVK